MFRINADPEVLEFIDSSFQHEFRPIDVVKLWKEKLFFDVTIQVGSEKFPAHRFVLYSRSPVFQKMFTSETRDKHKDCIAFDQNLINFDAGSFKLLLAFLYTGDIVFTPDNVMGVLSAADYFGIELLRHECIEYLTSLADEENALVIFKAGFLFSSERLTYFTYPTVWDNAHKLGEQINDLSFDEIHALLSTDNAENEYDRDENVAFRVTLQWVRHQKGRWNHLEKLLDKIILDEVESSQLMETLSDRDIRTNDAHFKKLMKVIRPRVTDDDMPKFKKRKTYNKSDGSFCVGYRNRSEMEDIISGSCLVRGLKWRLKVLQDQDIPTKYKLFLVIDSEETGWTFLTENKVSISPCSLDFDVQDRKVLTSRRHLFAPVDKEQYIGFFDVANMKESDYDKCIQIRVNFSVVITMA